MNYVSREVKER